LSDGCNARRHPRNPLLREAETDHILVCGAPGSGKGVAIKELLDQIGARGDHAILCDPSSEFVRV
jgi:putative protein kinase ArgK-like GTPase of G3E family